MKHFSILLAIMVTLLSCEKSAKTKEEANPASTASSGYHSSYGVKYPAPIQKYADKYCSCYADAAKKASELIELSIEHQEKLNSDLSCNEREKLQDAIITIAKDLENSEQDAEDKFWEWSEENFGGKEASSLVAYGEVLAQWETCPQVFFNREVVYQIETNYRYYDCDPNGSGSKESSNRLYDSYDENYDYSSDVAAPDPYYEDYDYWETVPQTEEAMVEEVAEEASDVYYDDYDYWADTTEEAVEGSYDEWDW